MAINNLSNMERVNKFGLMVPCMMATGEMEWLKDRVISIMQMVTYTKANFIKIELMDSVYMCIKMDRRMKVFGKMTCKMVQERKS